MYQKLQLANEQHEDTAMIRNLSSHNGERKKSGFRKQKEQSGLLAKSPVQVAALSPKGSSRNGFAEVLSILFGHFLWLYSLKAYISNSL